MTPPLVVRPHRLTRVCWAVAVATVAAFALVAVGLTRTSGELQFGPLDVVLMVALGAFLGGCALLFTRCRVVAGADGLRVRNPVGEKSYPWGVVEDVVLTDSSSWATLRLRDDDEVALLAVQTNDGERAVDAVRQLRALLAASRQGS